MKTLGWPPTYVARCPVTLFEAARGSASWQNSRTVGELHMRPLGGAVLHFQLNDLLDGQVLFEHTVRKPDAISVPVERFFVIRQENESFRGFGFRDKDAAHEMKERIRKSVKPFTIECASSVTATSKEQSKDKSDSTAPQTEGSSHKKSEALRCESVPKRSSVRSKSIPRVPEQSCSPQPPVETTVFSSSSTKSHVSTKWQRLKKGLRAISQIFVSTEHEMEIGYPTDVKHVAHIGWDGPSVNGPSWMDELRPAPDFSLGPLSDFSQPQGPGWIHDAASAARWTSQGLFETPGLPPDPPPEFTNAADSKPGKSKVSSFKSKSKSKASFKSKNN